MAPFPGVISQLPGCRLITWDPFRQERSVLCAYWDRHSAYRFAYSIASDQGTHLKEKGVWQWGYAHGISWSSRVHYPEAAGLIEW